MHYKLWVLIYFSMKNVQAHSLCITVAVCPSFNLSFTYALTVLKVAHVGENLRK